jgi:hypothetical protein
MTHNVGFVRTYALYHTHKVAISISVFITAWRVRECATGRIHTAGSLRASLTRITPSSVVAPRALQRGVQRARGHGRQPLLRV